MLSVLVAEDDEPLRRAISDALISAGYEVREVRDGDEGFRFIEEHPPDIVITDLFMPVRDGIELIGQIHRTAPDVPIIAMSGKIAPGTPDYLGMAKKLGAVRTLKKPFHLDELLNAIAACSRKRP